MKASCVRRKLSASPQARRNRAARPGKILVMFAILLPSLFGLIGLVVDGGQLMAERRGLQPVADAAATAAARSLALGRPAADVQQTAINVVKADNGLSEANVTVEIPPSAGPYAGLPGYVHVKVALPVETTFMHILSGDSTRIVGASATAGAEPATSGAAIIVLDPAPPPISTAPIPLTLPIPLPSLPPLIGGLEVLGLGTVTVEGAVLVNTGWGGQDEQGQVSAAGAGPPYSVACMPLLPLTRLRADDLRVVGGVDKASNYQRPQGGGSPLSANRLPVPDPFEDLPAPCTAADPHNVKLDYYGDVTVPDLSSVGGLLGGLLGGLTNKPQTLKPGIYDSITVAAAPVIIPVVFEPGIYIIRDNPWKPCLVIAGGPVTAEGVMFYITDSASYSAATGAPDSGDLEIIPPPPQTETLLPSVVITNLSLLSNRISGLDDAGSPFHNMLIYQRRTIRKPIVIVAEQLLGASRLAGTIYSKWGHLIFAGQGTFDLRFVVGTLRFADVINTRIAPSDLLPPAEDVYLVE